MRPMPEMTICWYPAKSTVPSIQARRRANVCGSTRARPSEIPSKMAPTAIPARTSLSGAIPPELSRPIRQTSAIVAMAPISAIVTKATGEVQPNTLNATAARKAAPALIPSTPVSAKGLRVITCSNAPALAKAEPATMAIIVRGTRRSRITEYSVLAGSRLISAVRASVSGMVRAPRLRLPTHSASVRKSRAIVVKANPELDLSLLGVQLDMVPTGEEFSRDKENLKGRSSLPI